MIFKKIKRAIFHIYALIKKNIKILLVFKYNLIISFISPIIGLIFPMIIMGAFFFEFNAQFGVWSANNFIIYQFIAFQIGLIKGLMGRFPGDLRSEKAWATLNLIIIAPFSRLNLLIGTFFTHFIIISIPFLTSFIICYIFFPISILTVFLLLMLYLLLALIFSGIGIILSMIAVAKIEYLKPLTFLISLLFMFSAVTYPFEIFPETLQNIINLNPFYYLFDLIRLAWIEDNFLFSITEHSLNYSILILFSLIFILISIYIFNHLYQKYGIEGA